MQVAESGPQGSSLTEIFKNLRLTELTEGQAETIEATMMFVGPPPAQSDFQVLFLNCGLAIAQLGTSIGTRMQYTHWDRVDSVAIGNPPTSQREVWSINLAGGYDSSMTAEWDKEPVIRTDALPTTIALGAKATYAKDDRIAAIAALRRHGVKVVEIS